MKVKSIVLMTVAVIIGVTGMGVPVCATQEDGAGSRDKMSTQANEVLEELFLIDSIAPAGNMIHYEFNVQGRTDMGIWALYLATYDYENVSMATADAGLGELGVVEEPTWAKAVFVDPAESTGGKRTTSANLNYTPGMDIGYNPGVLYYALEVYDGSKGEDKTESYWVRGKIDYREGAYNSMYGEPYMRMSCTGKNRWGRYDYSRWRSADDVYVSWGDEWSVTLEGNLESVETQIKELTDEDGVEDVKIELNRIEAVSVDATKEIEAKVKVEELRGLLSKKEVEIAQKKADEEEKRKQEEEEKRKQEEEEKRKEEEANKKPMCRPSGVGGMGVAGEVEKVEIPEVKQDTIEAAEDKNVGSKDIANVEIKNTVVSAEKTDTGSDREPGNVTVEEVGEVEVPVLREEIAINSKETGIMGRIWWGILIILASLMALGWGIWHRYGKKRRVRV